MAESMKPVAFASFNKQGDITRTVKRADGWSKIPLYTAAQLEQARKEDSDAITCFRALIKFLLRRDVDEKEQFLMLWNEGSFDECRKWWPEAPEEVYPSVEES